MEYYKQFKKHIQENNLPATVLLWQEYCLSDEVDPKEMILILEGIKGALFSNAFGVYIDTGLDLWKNLASSHEKDEVLTLIFDIQTTNSSLYAEIAHQYLHQKYGSIDVFHDLLKILGIRDGEGLQGCIRNFELLIHLQKGNFCLHNGGWGVGEVMESSLLRREVSIEFDLVSDVKNISFKNAFHSLKPISRDHFLARRFGDGEKFEAFTRANPIDAIKLLLKDMGDLTAFEIKEEMADLVIPEEEWTKWWSNVRGKLKKDGEIVYPESINEPFKLNEKRVSHQDRLKVEMNKVTSVDGLIEVVYEFLRDFGTFAKEKGLNDFLRKELGTILTDKKLNPSEEIQILFLLQDLSEPSVKQLKETIQRLSKVKEVLQAIPILAYKRRLLSEIESVREDWVKIYSELLVSKEKHPLRDFIYDQLIARKEDKECVEKLKEVIATPQNSPFAFLWFFQKMMKKKVEGFTDQRSLDALFIGFFVLMHYVEVSLKDRLLTKKMYGMLSEGRFEIVRRIFKEQDLSTTKEILLLATKCQIITHHDQTILTSLAEVVHPELKKEAKNQEEGQKVIWTTSEGVKKITARLEEIATKEMIENAKDIETARGHGDLRENSEYKFAQEKRASLQKELKNLSLQLKMMRVLSKEDIDTTKVSVGTKVVIKNQHGEEKEYAILGPYDADVDKNIISDQSNLAKDLLDKKVGQKVTVNGNEWRIITICSIL
jgi:transcription elongation factor GreA-like protein/transcription elongation GreA/GreB family factor